MAECNLLKICQECLEKGCRWVWRSGNSGNVLKSEECLEVDIPPEGNVEFINPPFVGWCPQSSPILPVEPEPKESQIGVEVISGIIIGSILLFIIVAGLIALVVQRRHRRRSSHFRTLGQAKF